MNNSEMPLVIKWKYKVVKPVGKGDKGSKGSKAKRSAVDGYIDYLSRQVIDRRNKSGLFEFDKDNAYGYVRYLDERKGSHALFSYKDADIDELKERLRRHDGTIWIPIVSLKEDYAKEFGLLNEEDFILLARSLSNLFCKSLSIDEDNYHWLAAFHTKSLAEQNGNSDAGCQPHLHFILFEDEPRINKKPAISHKKLEELRISAANIISRDYMKKSYEIRNKLRKDIIDKVDNLEDLNIELHSLLTDIGILTNRKGKLSLAEFEKGYKVTQSIEDKILSNKELTKQERFYKEYLNIDSYSSLLKTIHLYDSILNRLDDLVNKILDTKESKLLLDEWFKVSKTMRSVQGKALSDKQNDKDLESIKRQMKNAILRKAKTLNKSNTFISKKFKGMLIEKISNGTFKSDISSIDLKDSVKVTGLLLKECGLKEKEALFYIERLSASLEERKRRLALEELHLIYKKLETGLDVSTLSFMNTMKLIGTPVNDVSVYNSNFSPYELANDIMLETVIRNSVNALNEVPDFLKIYEKTSLLSKSLSSLSLIPKTNYCKKRN